MNFNCNEDVEVCSNVTSSLNESLSFMSDDYSEYQSSDLILRKGLIPTITFLTL